MYLAYLLRHEFPQIRCFTLYKISNAGNHLYGVQSELLPGKSAEPGLWRNCASFFWTQEQNLLTVLCSWDRYCSIWRHLWRASPILNSFHVLHSILGLMPLTLLSSGRAVLGWCTEKWHILWLYSLSPPTSSPNKEQTQSPSPSLCQTEPYRGFSTNPSVLGGCWLPGLLHLAFLSAVHKVRRSFGCLLHKHKKNSG